MQRELAWLVGGLGLASLSSCDAPPSPAPAPAATWVATASGSAGEAPHPPTGRWCGKPELAEGMRFMGSPEVDGCAKFIDGEKIPKGQEQHPNYVEMPRSTLGFFDPIVTQMRRAAIGRAPLCCYNWREKTPGGRPLVSEGQAWLAELAPERDAGLRSLELLRPRGNVRSAAKPARRPEFELPPGAQRERLANHWLTQARLEHASVASFARARLELLALGAPRALLAAYCDAARDELAHAALCLSVARAWGAGGLRLGALHAAAPRPGGVNEIAQRTLEEAFEPEATAALALYRLSRSASCPRLGQLLLSIAEDERRHAALALRTLAWCRAVGADTSALRLPELAAEGAAQPASLGAASAFGELRDADWPALRALCRREVVCGALTALG